MPIGNIVKSKANDLIRKRLGQYSSIAMNYAGGPLNDLAARINATEQEILGRIPGGLSQIGKVVFDRSKTGIPVGAKPKTVPWSVVGITADGDDDIPEYYKVKIGSTNLGVRVVAALQEKTSYRITSEWEPFLPVGAVTNLANAATQLVSGKALVSRFMTRRIWKGTSPVTINMNLKFEAIGNTYDNVIAPTMALMQMVLPSGAGKTAIGPISVPLLAPPGPSPFVSEEGKQNVVGSGQSSTGEGSKAFADYRKVLAERSDKINVNIGGYMFFESVIIKDVQPSYDSRLSVDGWPIRADVQIEFETYEILTKEVLAAKVFKPTSGAAL